MEIDQLDTFDSGADPDGTPSRRGWYLAVIGSVAAIAVIIGVVAWTSSGDDDEQPVEDVAIVTPEAQAKPDDGLDSIGLPVTVTPATGLPDVATVEVSASGFEPNESVGVVQCTTMSSTLGQGGCDMGSLRSMMSVEADGTFTTTYTVRRFINVGGVEIDCGLGNIDPATWSSGQPTAEGQFSCIVGIGAIQNYDRSGNALISFEGAVFGGPPPSIPSVTTLPPGSDPSCPEGPRSTDPCSPTTTVHGTTPTTSRSGTTPTTYRTPNHPGPTVTSPDGPTDTTETPPFEEPATTVPGG